jgi:osmotically-inducible protein OsmY
VRPAFLVWIAAAALSLAVATPLVAQSASPAGAVRADADAALRARVEAALARAADVPADSVTVEVGRGTVTIAGSLLCEGCGGNATPGGSATVQQSLGAVVRAVPGVERVVFRLRYRPS